MNEQQPSRGAEDTKPPKDKWDKLGVLSGLLIPIVVGLVGGLLTWTLRSRELQVEYVKVAVGVLQGTDTAQSARELRGWAVSVMDKLGPVDLTPELRSALVEGRVALPRGGAARGGRGSGLASLEIESRRVQASRSAWMGRARAERP